MQFSTADRITKSILMNHKYPVHWYTEVLKYVSDCLAELSMDDLKIVNSVWLNLNAYKAAPIPPDFIDYVRIGRPNGEYVRPFIQNEGYNRMNNYDASGNKIPWPQVPNGGMDLTIFGIPYFTFYMNMYNSRGENIGGLYGYRTDGSPFTFDIIPERNEIQFDSALDCDQLVMDYISDGRNANAATMIPIYAEATLRAYVDWQLEEYNRSTPASEKERLKNWYLGQRVVLRGRMNDLTIDDYLGVYRNSYNAAPKT